MLGIIGLIIATVMFGGKIKEFSEEAQKNPARATATMMVSVSGGALEMVAEDNDGKRYTVKEKKTGALTTIYWDEKSQKPEVIQGDFSAIPSAAVPGSGEP